MKLDQNTISPTFKKSPSAYKDTAIETYFMGTVTMKYLQTAIRSILLSSLFPFPVPLFMWPLYLSFMNHHSLSRHAGVTQLSSHSTVCIPAPCLCNVVMHWGDTTVTWQNHTSEHQKTPNSEISLNVMQPSPLLKPLPCCWLIVMHMVAIKK